MSIFTVALSVIAQAKPEPAPASNSPIELAVWKWVVIIGIAAIIILYAVKRISEVVVKKKTDEMIRTVVGEDAKPSDGSEDWEDFEEMDRKLGSDD